MSAPAVCGGFFEYTFKHCLELRNVWGGEALVSGYIGGDNGGHLLFRPLGWDLYTGIIIEGLKPNEDEMNAVIKGVLAKDLYLGGSVLRNKISSPKQKRILKLSAKNQKLITRELLAQLYAKPIRML
jgi:DNA sulfur modification protein DndB